MFILHFTVAAHEAKDPGIVIAHPGQDVELLCGFTMTAENEIGWFINHAGPYTVQQLSNGIEAGYSSNCRNLRVENIMMNDVRNGSVYSCVILSQHGNSPRSDPTILYVAGECRCQLYFI